MFSKGFLFLVMLATPADALTVRQPVHEASDLHWQWTEKANTRADASVVTKELMEVLDAHASHAIEHLTGPTVPLAKCGGNLDEEGLKSGGGAYYGWCPNAIQKVIQQQGKNALGLSYGIFTWDSWSRKMTNKYSIPTELYDCYMTKERSNIKQYQIPYNFHQVCLGKENMTMHGGNDEGRRFETLQMHLKDRKPLSTFIKMDIEGSEWEALPKLLASPEDLDKVATLDFEYHFCELEKFDTLELLEKLADKFYVVARHPSAKTANLRGACATMSGKGSVPGPCMSVSYVNKKLVEQLKEGEQFPGAPAVNDRAWLKK